MSSPFPPLMVCIAVAALCDPAGAAETSSAARPNVIIVLSDDQCYGDFSCHGNPVLRTPNLDKLHAQSIRLTDFHVAPMCSPTRGQLITGLDALHNEEVQAFIEFEDNGTGHFRFGYVQGCMDWRVTTWNCEPAVEWSWEVKDEMDPAHGRGRAKRRAWPANFVRSEAGYPLHANVLRRWC